MRLKVGCVVEGHGEVEALPVLLRRLGAKREPPVVVEVRKPVRLGRAKALTKPDELERAVALAALNAGAGGAVLVLLDADDDCPAELGPRLLQRVRARVPATMPVSVVIAKREFESWFLAALPSLRGKRGIRATVSPPADAEAVRGAKEKLGHCMERGLKYRETVDQAALAAVVDLEMAKRAPSFCKLVREFEALCHAMGNQPSSVEEAQDA